MTQRIEVKDQGARNLGTEGFRFQYIVGEGQASPSVSFVGSVLSQVKAESEKGGMAKELSVQASTGTLFRLDTYKRAYGVREIPEVLDHLKELVASRPSVKLIYIPAGLNFDQLERNLQNADPDSRHENYTYKIWISDEGRKRLTSSYQAFIKENPEGGFLAFDDSDLASFGRQNGSQMNTNLKRLNKASGTNDSFEYTGIAAFFADICHRIEHGESYFKKHIEINGIYGIIDRSARVAVLCDDDGGLYVLDYGPLEFNVSLGAFRSPELKNLVVVS